MQLPRAVPGTDEEIWANERVIPSFELAGFSPRDVDRLMSEINGEIDKFFTRSGIPAVFAAEIPAQIPIYPQREVYGAGSNQSHSMSVSDYVTHVQNTSEKRAPLDIKFNAMLLDLKPEDLQSKQERGLTLQMQWELARAAIRRCFSPLETLHSDVFGFKIASQATYYPPTNLQKFLGQIDTEGILTTSGCRAPDHGITSVQGEVVDIFYKLLLPTVLRDISMESTWKILMVLRSHAEQCGSMITAEKIAEAACYVLGEMDGTTLSNHALLRPAKTGRQCMLIPSKDGQRAYAYPFIVRSHSYPIESDSGAISIEERIIQDDPDGICTWSEVRGKAQMRTPPETVIPFGSIDSAMIKNWLRRMGHADKRHEVIWHVGPNDVLEFRQTVGGEGHGKAGKSKRK